HSPCGLSGRIISYWQPDRIGAPFYWSFGPVKKHLGKPASIGRCPQWSYLRTSSLAEAWEDGSSRHAETPSLKWGPLSLPDEVRPLPDEVRRSHPANAPSSTHISPIDITRALPWRYHTG